MPTSQYTQHLETRKVPSLPKTSASLDLKHNFKTFPYDHQWHILKMYFFDKKVFMVMLRTLQLASLPTDTHSQTSMHSLNTFPFRVFLPVFLAFLVHSLRSLLWVQSPPFKKYYNRIYPQHSSYQDLSFLRVSNTCPLQPKNCIFGKPKHMRIFVFWVLVQLPLIPLL